MSLVSAWIDDKDCVEGRQDGTLSSYFELEACDNLKQDSSSTTKDAILLTDIVQIFLAYLPLESIVTAGLVCKHWFQIVHSRSFSSIASSVLSRKPWYFMFAESDPLGFAYDPMLEKWYRFEFPYVGSRKIGVSSSHALTCFQDSDGQNWPYVCNPITKLLKKLQVPPDLAPVGYCFTALAISVDRLTHNYTVVIVVSNPDGLVDLDQWKLNVHVYHSESMIWESPVAWTLNGWRGGENCVICDGVLYIPLYSVGAQNGRGDIHHRLFSFDLSTQISGVRMSDDSLISMPCPLTCCQLIDLNNKLALVGGVEKRHKRGRIRGIGIWLLKGNDDWEEVARLSVLNEIFQEFEGIDDVFTSSGADDTIYIHSYETPSLLMFDINTKEWKWAPKCPVRKMSSLEIFTGFCLLPRLDVSPKTSYPCKLLNNN